MTTNPSITLGPAKDIPLTAPRSPAWWLIALVALGFSTPCFGFDKPTAWGANTSLIFPVVPVFNCPNHFATAFPGFAWNNIRGHALAAGNQWFVQGNADLRLRVRPNDLPATDTRCSSGSGAAGTGQVLLTAETNFGVAGVCRWASTFGGPGSAKVILHRGCVNGMGTYSNLDWATNAEFPGTGQGDFMAVLLHEFGHAIGFNHTTEGSAVMFPSLTGLGNDSNRTLSRDEILGLQDAQAPYGPIQTTSLHRRAAATNLSSWLNEGEPTSTAMFGAPSVDHATRFEATSLYLMAFIRAMDNAVTWGRTDGVSNWAAGFAAVPSTFSYRPPAVVGDAASSQEVLAYVNDTQAGEVVFRTNATGATWGAPTTLGSEVSRVGPALGYLANRNVYVMAWPTHPTGRIKTAISTDNGTTFINVQEWPTTRTHHRIGVACPNTDECLLGFSDGTHPYTRWSFQVLSYSSAAQTFSAGASGNLAQDSYGGGLDFSPNRTQFAWRDRGTATLPTTGGWGTVGTLTTLTFIPTVAHSAPDVAYTPTGQNFTLWSTFAARYNQ